MSIHDHITSAILACQESFDAQPKEYRENLTECAAEVAAVIRATARALAGCDCDCQSCQEEAAKLAHLMSALACVAILRGFGRSLENDGAVRS